MGKCQLCDPYSYPEKFVIEVSSREACRSSRIKLNFTGTLPENLSTGVQLHYPIAQSGLQYNVYKFYGYSILTVYSHFTSVG